MARCGLCFGSLMFMIWVKVFFLQEEKFIVVNRLIVKNRIWCMVLKFELVRNGWNDGQNIYFVENWLFFEVIVWLLYQVLVSENEVGIVMEIGIVYFEYLGLYVMFYLFCYV